MRGPRRYSLLKLINIYINNIVSLNFLGSPSSFLYWVYKGKTIDSNFITKNKKTRNTLTIQNVAQKYNNSKLICIGGNNNKTEPLSKALTVLVNSK